MEGSRFAVFSDSELAHLLVVLRDHPGKVINPLLVEARREWHHRWNTHLTDARIENNFAIK